ncbi:MAG TPA: tetratricopeptide repeat protein [Thermoanaerobaculia bacterium]|nr:tetratricopeptide repeat protein [Thermoanaerobaculia bacterium]
MSDLSARHLDDFTLLRYVAGELTAAEQGRASRHLSGCSRCTRIEIEIRRLDGELRALDASVETASEIIESLPPGDAFRSRPPRVERRPRPGGAAALAAAAIPASEEALPLSEEILAASHHPPSLAEWLDNLALGQPAPRYALLYALQQSGRGIAEGPLRCLRFAEEALTRLRREPFATDSEKSDAERMVPRLVLRGHAHLLAGQACLWTREFERARSHLELAYRSLARGGAEEMTLAMVEVVESQRRSFLGRGREALVLASRARATFEAWSLEDEAARARVAAGLAYFDLGDQESALREYRQALPIFERHGLWSNYVGTLNSIGTSLTRAGRLDEARREYARALRRLSRREHASWAAFIRHGLADVLFESGRYREAAIALARASRLYADCGMTARSLAGSLFEVEAWARFGDLSRARHRFQLFLSAAASHQALTESIIRQMSEVLGPDRPDLNRFQSLRGQTGSILQERLGQVPA